MTPDFTRFRETALAQGFTEVVERVWHPGQVVAEHTHPFEASALVVQGEMWLIVGIETRYLQPGDRFHLAAEQAHSDRYGPEGATYWVARR